TGALPVRLLPLALRADQRGYTMVELLVVMSIMGAVMGGLTTVFVSAAKAELDMNRRFQAQQNARVALARVRRETHCATSVTPAGPASTVTLNLPVQCKIATGAITWCALPVTGSPSRYKLYRSLADPCGDGDDAVYADYLTSDMLFEHKIQTDASLGSLKVTLPVDIDTSKPGSYTLEDTLVMRNTTRSCIAELTPYEGCP
ncbi:MAG TPA: type II secretion system protein, partial [Longimicrobiales bacterium]|nr:type II secretion system protein [Longimicrobiales bacterium]